MKKISQALWQAGKDVFKQGDERDFAYLLAKGEVDIIHHINGVEVVKDVLGEGELFGEMALMGEGLRTATARARTDCTLFVVPKSIIHERLENLDPVIGALFGLLIDRYRNARLWEKPRARSAINTRREMNTDSKLISKLKMFQEQAIEELHIEDKITRAILNEEFLAHLQPIVNLNTGQVTGFETLIRWNDPTEGLITPDNFIPVAERTNQIQLLDRMMLNNASHILPGLKTALGQDVFVSVNFSSVHLADDNIVESVKQAIAIQDINPENIKLEITESALVSDPDTAQRVLSDLKDLGVTIALDDFGTGYSSLSYLHRFPIDSIKIDRSFIKNMRSEEKSHDIVKAIVHMADAFGMDVIAEGIESNEDIPVLTDMGCEMGQGYAFGRPSDINDIDLTATSFQMPSNPDLVIAAAE